MEDNSRVEGTQSDNWATQATQLMMLLLLVLLQIRQIHFQTNTNESLLARKENIGAKF